MSTGMRKWMEKDCPEIQCLPAQVSIDREELKQLRDRLEAAEKERDVLRDRLALESQENGALRDSVDRACEERDALRAKSDTRKAVINLLHAEIDALRAEIEAMEKQEPVATAIKEGDSRYWISERLWTFPDGKYMLYALPGAQAQPAPKAVAYLDLGVGGYMDIGTNLTDKELATLPKGRHMLGVIGTYGVDGYVPAQNGPSVPDTPAKSLKPVINWLRSGCDPMRAADELEILIAAAPKPEVKP